MLDGPQIDYNKACIPNSGLSDTTSTTNLSENTYLTRDNPYPKTRSTWCRVFRRLPR
jgi:hypothetical protein